MFFIIRNICNNFNNELKKTRKLPLNDHVYNISNESLESEKDIALQNIINKMDKELENWHFYEKGIFKIYRDSGLSIRGIAKETKISSVNIFHTLKKSKNKMREMFGEDFEDYINGDFDLID
jgi:DNA-directed RNA polymerase specialized sigma subunit